MKIIYASPKEKIAEELKNKYPGEFKGEVGSIAKQIQIQPSWKKWKETREKFIGKDFGSDQCAIRVEKFDSVVLDYLMSVRNLKDRTRENKHGGMYDTECVGMTDEEYLKLASRITPMMAAQWAKQHERDYIEIGEIFRWSARACLHYP